MELGLTAQQCGHIVAAAIAILVWFIVLARLLFSFPRASRVNWWPWLMLHLSLGLLLWQTTDLLPQVVPESVRPGILLAVAVAVSLLCGISSWAWNKGGVPTWMGEMALLCVGGFVFGLGVYGASSDSIPLFEESNFVSPALLSGAGNHQLSGKQAVTDRGRPIALYTAANKPALPDRRLPDPGVYWPEQAFGSHLIRTARPDPNYNCHGWVFTAGQYILAPDDVQRILEDNGYYEVQQPKPGDVVIYYDPAGMITHTALVRAVGDDGFVLVESKWGCSGARYLHLPDLWFSAKYVYYRTNRGSHVVQGLEQQSPRLPLAVQSR